MNDIFIIIHRIGSWDTDMNKTVSDRLCDSEGHGTKLLVDEVIFLHLELFNDGWGALETGESPTPESV